MKAEEVKQRGLSVLVDKDCGYPAYCKFVD